jgi:4-hydroxy-tetrahydrodipicolinate reductase
MGLKLVVVGAAGRMGRRIIALAVESGRFDVVAAVEKAGCKEIGEDAGLLAGANALNVPVSDAWPARADVAIDFSLPEAADNTIEICSANKIPLVMGTTGLSDKHREALRAAAQSIPIVYATNMSVGMNVLFSLVGKVAAMLGDAYDIEIVEQHHRFKKDAPSGSALTLAHNICKATGRPCPASLIHGRGGKEALRKTGEIGMHAIRAGDITGVHSVLYATLGETITLNHTAHSRDTFVRGALRAAEWLIGKPPARYAMADVLGIK